MNLKFKESKVLLVNNQLYVLLLQDLLEKLFWFK